AGTEYIVPPLYTPLAVTFIPPAPDAVAVAIDSFVTLSIVIVPVALNAAVLPLILAEFLLANAGTKLLSVIIPTSAIAIIFFFIQLSSYFFILLIYGGSIESHKLKLLQF